MDSGLMREGYTSTRGKFCSGLKVLYNGHFLRLKMFAIWSVNGRKNYILCFGFLQLHYTYMYLYACIYQYVLLLCNFILSANFHKRWDSCRKCPLYGIFKIMANNAFYFLYNCRQTLLVFGTFSTQEHFWCWCCLQSNQDEDCKMNGEKIMK